MQSGLNYSSILEIAKLKVIGENKAEITLQDKGQLMFEDKWPSMRPIVLKLLQQEPVTQNEWQDLFYSVHLVCLWDEKGPPKVKDALRDDIMDFIQRAQTVSRHNSHQVNYLIYMSIIDCIVLDCPCTIFCALFNLYWFFYRTYETSRVGATFPNKYLQYMSKSCLTSTFSTCVLAPNMYTLIHRL